VTRGIVEKQINIRHVAALAGALLCGWYLMLPPIIRDGQGGFTVLFDAPLSKWIVNTSFEQAADCDQLQRGFVMDSGKKTRRFASHTFEWAETARLTQAQCIATDDPRLAK
jgi:hypothetical protein